MQNLSLPKNSENNKISSIIFIFLQQKMLLLFELCSSIGSGRVCKVVRFCRETPTNYISGERARLTDHEYGKMFENFSKFQKNDVFGHFFDLTHPTTYNKRKSVKNHKI